MRRYETQKIDPERHPWIALSGLGDVLGDIDAEVLPPLDLINEALRPPATATELMAWAESLLPWRIRTWQRVVRFARRVW